MHSSEHFTQAGNVWLVRLASLIGLGLGSSSRGLKTLELLNQTSTVNMATPLVNVAGRHLSENFALAEAQWILSGANNLSALEPHAPSYGKYSDDGLTLYGAYGPRFVNQYNHVLQTLVKEPSSRQAFMSLWINNPGVSRDIPCTLSVGWMIRHGRLHCFDYMRSSDIWRGWVYDVFSFTMATMALWWDLLGAGIDCLPGELHLTAASQHLYVSDIAKAQALLNSRPEPKSRSIDWGSTLDKLRDRHSPSESGLLVVTRMLEDTLNGQFQLFNQ